MGEGGPVEGYLSGWSDDVVPHLVQQRKDLEPHDLAVLALIYLHTEVLGRMPVTADLGKLVDKAYQDKTLTEIVDAPVSALS
ncbi:hypothetical protein HCB18_27185, partial [Salinispora arenicola]|nr:hypothetical protein [Salinispora arenicola]